MKNQTEVSNKSIARHTPKTWKVRESGHPDIEGSLWIDSNESIKPALAFGKDNARLIAAAPEMLEALKDSADAINKAIIRLVAIAHKCDSSATISDLTDELGAVNRIIAKAEDR